MKVSIKFWLMLFSLFSFPLYILTNSLLHGFFKGLLFHRWSFELLVFGFPCEVYQTNENIIFFSIFLCLRLIFYIAGYILLRFLTKTNISLFFFLLIAAFWIFDFYSILAFITDNIFESYLRFFFYAATSLYKLSYALNIPLLIIPTISLGLGMFFIIKLCKVFFIKEMMLFFGLNLVSLMITAMILIKIMDVSVFL